VGGFAGQMAHAPTLDMTTSITNDQGISASPPFRVPRLENTALEQNAIG
jgi:hypothetical protein